MQVVLANLPAMLFTLALGSALLGLLIWVLAAQGAAQKRWARSFWGLAAGLALLGLFRLLGP
ncbi:hypothetical protein [Meiothermus rufus]|uniref:hypothetical protein n=1 Tax=Meiothermus rufus TaxID=604332 RepID=UPI000426F18F|nr:hypothetical protein [Meiothermus rufus]